MFDGKTKLLENYLNYCSAKTKIVSKNIANIGTEGYARQDVRFDNVLKENLNGRLKAENRGHMDKPLEGGITDKGYRVIADQAGENFSGINNVDIDREMADLAANTLKFKFATKKINGYYNSIQSVIKGR